MEWSLLYTFISHAIQIPPVAAGIGAVIGATIGSLWTNHFTRKREDEKLLREKAEALILLVHQLRHRMATWTMAIDRQSVTAFPSRVECPDTLLLDVNQIWMLQDLYFSALASHITAMVDTLMSYAKWLEDQWDQLDRDTESWRAQYHPEDGTPLYNAYSTACTEMIAAIVRAVPRSRQLARALAHQRR
jgi:hypothetical protein